MGTIKQALEGISDQSAGTIAGAIDQITVAHGGTVSTPSKGIADAVAKLGATLETLEAYVVTFGANSGSGTVDPVACAKGATVELPAGTGLTRSGYRFGGWAATAGAASAAYQAGDSLAATADTTLYAFWVQQYTVSYDANGGSGTITAKVVDAGQSYTLPDGSALTAPSEKVFAGWGTASDSDTALTSPYTPDQTRTLYAIWEDEPAEAGQE